MARKRTVRSWARLKGDRWWHGKARAAGFTEASIVLETEYERMMGRLVKPLDDENKLSKKGGKNKEPSDASESYSS